MNATWLNTSELRVGLGCMRLSTDDDRNDDRAIATIAAAAASGITVFDTARAYEDNEQLLAGALRACGAATAARIVTKGGMSRPGGAWAPDGRAKAIRADCEASLEALVQRDVKGLYKKALAGEIPHFTGISDPYEPPESPEVTVRTDSETVEAGVERILAALLERGLTAQR